MTNKNPRTRLVNVPAQFYPLLTKELEDTGCFSYCELMGRILTQHFNINPSNNGQKATNDNKPAKKEPVNVIKGVK